MAERIAGDNIVLYPDERIRNTIRLGESHYSEFKSALDGKEGNKKPRSVKEICKDIAENLVSFANADGGDLLIGVEDDGTITGIPHNENDINTMINAVNTHLLNGSRLPLGRSTKISIDDRVLLFFSVNKGADKIYQLSDGRCLKRNDKQNIPVSFDVINFERKEANSREYDRCFIDGAQVTDLDIDLIQSLADSYLRGLSVARYLQQLNIAEYTTSGMRLRKAALLLFSKDIQKWHPRCQVRILKVKGTELLGGKDYNVEKNESLRGNIFELLISSWERLSLYLSHKTEREDNKFVPKYIYPEGACRESLINAIAHRDYSIQNGIEIYIFDDRMEIKSPGALLSTIKIEELKELKGAHESRNSLITSVLAKNKIMRELGEGLKNIFDIINTSDLKKPELSSDSQSFTITLYHKSVFTEKELNWLKLFENFKLTPRQKRIVVLGMDGREISPNDIFRVIYTDRVEIYAEEISFLIKYGILIKNRTLSDTTLTSKSQNIDKKEVKCYKIGISPEPKPEIERRVYPAEQGLYIGNLSNAVTESDLRNLFGEFGNIIEIHLPQKPDKKGRMGFGFICFENSESVKNAIEKMNGHELCGKIIRLGNMKDDLGINLNSKL
ncbi:MAG: putative DNA binding domain-containing protein [Nitrospirae bacterium]|nr:putative DNA binding domain-containing protein [Nitrospirota bacterium]